MSWKVTRIRMPRGRRRDGRPDPRMSRVRLVTGPMVAVGMVAGVVGCAPASSPGGVGGPAPPLPRPAGIDPSRSGSLRQDQISVRITAGALRIEVTPLAAWVLEAAAPDTHARLTRIAEAHGPELTRRAGGTEAVLFLVSFSSIRPGADFQPDDLHMVSRGLRQRPLAIRAITPGWGSQQLSQRATATAVYAYGSGLDLSRDLRVVYQGSEDSSWSSKVTVIEAERGRIPTGGHDGVTPDRTS